MLIFKKTTTMKTKICVRLDLFRVKATKMNLVWIRYSYPNGLAAPHFLKKQRRLKPKTLTKGMRGTRAYHSSPTVYMLEVLLFVDNFARNGQDKRVLTWSKTVQVF